MRINIHTPVAGLADQVRAYAEYRVFSAVARFGRTVQLVDVTIDADNNTNDAEHRTAERQYSCSIVARTTDGEQIAVRAGSDHPYSVVDRASRQMTAALERKPSPARTTRHAADVPAEAL
jgi:ribosome-associated translation inhibitor RaiA